MDLRSGKNNGGRSLRSGALREAPPEHVAKKSGKPNNEPAARPSRADRAAARDVAKNAAASEQMADVPPTGVMPPAAPVPETAAPAPMPDVPIKSKSKEVAEPAPVVPKKSKSKEVAEPAPVVPKESKSEEVAAVQPEQLAPNVVQNLLQRLDGNQAGSPAAAPTANKPGTPVAVPAAKKRRNPAAVPAAKKPGTQAAVPDAKKPAKRRTGKGAGPNGIPLPKNRRQEVDEKYIVDTQRKQTKRFDLKRRAPPTNKNSRRAMLLKGVRIAQRNSSEDVFYKAPFRYLVIQIAQSQNQSELRYTAESLKILQEIIEHDVIRLLEIAQLASSHARPGRGVADSKPKVLRSDIDFSYRMKFRNHLGETGLEHVNVY